MSIHRYDRYNFEKGHTASTLPDASYQHAISEALASRRQSMETAVDVLLSRIDMLTEAATSLVETLQSGHKALVAGNGGSAAEAQHFVAELVGRFKRERAPYAAIALTADSAIVTAIANDYGFQDVFARQVYALGQPEDMLIAFSTSGESENLVRAAQAGHQLSMRVTAVTGDKPNRLARLADVAVRIPGIDTATTQELHMMITHILCDIVEKQLSGCDNQDIGADSSRADGFFAQDKHPRRFTTQSTREDAQ
jgi:D-sedoheptulose 7-phosphate isomerase